MGRLALENTLVWKEREKPTVEWAKRYGGDFDSAMKFLDTSRRRKLIRKIVSLGSIIAVIVAAVAIILATWAFWERSKAEEAQEEAELNSSRFQEMVNATFGFLLESGQNKKFLVWTKKTSVIERLNPALELMIDLSERLDEEEKKFWHTVLPNMTEAQKLELLDILGSEAAEKAIGEKKLRINKLVIKDSIGSTVPIISGKCFLKPYETVTMSVEVKNPSNRSFKIEYSAERGEVGSDASYIAPNEPGGVDTVIIRVLDNNSGTIIDQKTITIKIIDTLK